MWGVTDFTSFHYPSYDYSYPSMWVLYKKPHRICSLWSKHARAAADWWFALLSYLMTPQKLGFKSPKQERTILTLRHEREENITSLWKSELALNRQDQIYSVHWDYRGRWQSAWWWCSCCLVCEHLDIVCLCPCSQRKNISFFFFFWEIMPSFRIAVDFHNFENISILTYMKREAKVFVCVPDYTYAL